jgi:hypothetical protein
VTFDNYNNTLLRRLLQVAPEAAASLERVPLTPGTWPQQCDDSDDHVYFPEAGLVSLWRSAPPGTATVFAMVGCHSCLLPGYWRPGPFQAHVVVAGHAQRLHGSVVQSDQRRQAAWMLETAKASQQLIRQMAQMTFCVQHHGVAQRMASWLLICLNQNARQRMQIQLSELRRWLCATPEQWQEALAVLQAHSAIRLESPCAADRPDDHGAMATVLHTLEPERLAQLACSCHGHVRVEGSAHAHDGA